MDQHYLTVYDLNVHYWFQSSVVCLRMTIGYGSPVIYTSAYHLYQCSWFSDLFFHILPGYWCWSFNNIMLIGVTVLVGPIWCFWMLKEWEWWCANFNDWIVNFFRKVKRWGNWLFVAISEDIPHPILKNFTLEIRHYCSLWHNIFPYWALVLHKSDITYLHGHLWSLCRELYIIHVFKIPACLWA